MKEALRCLGIKFSVKGTMLLEMLIDNQTTVSKLTTQEVDAVLDAWQTRKFVPIEEVPSAIDSRPARYENETEEQYDRRHIEEIVKIVRTI